MAGKAIHLTCEDLCCLDVRKLARDGLLTGSNTINWTWGDQVTGGISLYGDGRSVTLAYSFAGQEIRERVLLEKTALNFGGSRSYFLCPGCGGRVAILYGGRLFRCRHCHDLRYTSQRKSGSTRALMRVQKARMKLGGTPNLTEPRPKRPRNMHQRTYDRLVLEETAAWQAYTITFRNGANPQTNRVD